MADTEDALERVSKVGNKSRAKGRSPWVQNLAILNGRNRNRMHGEKSMDLRPTRGLGSMVITAKEIFRGGGLLRCNA